MYVTHARGKNPGSYRSYTRTTKGFTTLESVYSFRTGPGLKGQVQTSYKPRGQTLISKLQDRKEYLEGLDRSFSGERAPISYSQGRTNSFTKITHSTSGYGKQYYRDRASLPFELISEGNFFGYPLLPASFTTTAFDGYSTAGGIGIPPSRIQMQNFGSKMHHALNPLKNAVGLGETIAEILSGNIPKLGSKLYRSVSDMSFTLKKAPKDASQDFLNANFGLGPIFGDLYQLLIEGVTLHDALYGTSYRRKASSPLFSHTAFERANWRTGVYTRRPNGTFNPTVGGVRTDPNMQQSTTIVQDLRFAGRFTLARDTAANGYYDRALILIRKYGFWTPSLLWELMPWSWLFDWFLNLSRGFTVAYDFGKDGGLKSDYACVTSKTVVQVSLPAVNYRAGNYRTEATPGLAVTTTIARIPVNPFGQYVELPNLSTWQKSILLALGIVKSTR